MAESLMTSLLWSLTSPPQTRLLNLSVSSVAVFWGVLCSDSRSLMQLQVLVTHLATEVARQSEDAVTVL